MNKKIGSALKAVFPFVFAAATILIYYFVKDVKNLKKMVHPYFVYVLLAAVAVYAVLLVAGFFCRKVLRRTVGKAPFFSGVIVFLCLLNFLTTKTKLLPALYFPSLDRIFAVLLENKLFLLKNVLSSLGLLLQGASIGFVVGFFTGLALGYNKKVGYWLNPVTKFLGPIPTTAWIPLALSVFPTTHAANVFLISFAVWFPVTLMTSSGIQGVSNVNFEVARTLGASTLYQVVHVAIPASMPSIFLGLFYGTVSSFATLMAVEMNGNSSGIGWYINWQKQVMLYDGVYAGLIFIALICTFTLTLLFKVRDRVLVWQKGVIKW